jgi:RND family efflux transporter MFP subunit
MALGYRIVVVAGALLMPGSAMAYTVDCLIAPSRVVRIGTPVGGLIAEVAVERGDWVERGAPVARLDTLLQDMAIQSAQARASASRAALQSAEARVGFLSGQLERNRALQERNVVSMAVVEEVEANLLVARNEVLTAQQNLTMAQLDIAVAETERDRRVITSPVTGYVIERALSAGEYWSEADPIITVADIETLYVEAIADLDAFGAIALGQVALVEPEAPVGGSYEAEVAVIDPVFDAASGTFGVRLVLPNPELVLPAGLRCKVTFAAAALEDGQSLVGPDRPE